MRHDDGSLLALEVGNEAGDAREIAIGEAKIQRQRAWLAVAAAREIAAQRRQETRGVVGVAAADEADPARRGADELPRRCARPGRDPETDAATRERWLALHLAARLRTPRCR